MSILQSDPAVVHAAPDDTALPAVTVRAALVALASALGTNDSRAPYPTSLGDGLRALHGIHAALWAGQPYDRVRVDITFDLIDAYWLGVNADRTPCAPPKHPCPVCESTDCLCAPERWTAEERAEFAALPEGGW